MPALIELYSPGDQRVYMYMGETDSDKEFPIARYDSQPEVWISASSVIHYIFDCVEEEDLTEVKIDFEKALKQAVKKNEKFVKEEHWHKDFVFP